MRKKPQIIISMVILTAMLLIHINNSTYTYATPENDDGIHVGEQKPPTKPPTSQTPDEDDTEIKETETPENNDKTHDENKDNNTETPIVIENMPDPIFYTITFDLNGGQGTVPNISVPANTTTNTINTHVTKDGYDFIGWYTQYNQPLTKDTVITENITATAKWEPNGTTPYTVIQKCEKLDGSYEEYQTTRLKTDANTTITVTPEPIEGFTAPDKQELFITEDGTASVTFQYTRNIYKLNIKTKTGVINKQKTFTYKYNEPVTLNIYLQDNYTNLKIKGDAKDKKFKMPAKDINITVSATPTTYNIRYKGRGIDTSHLVNSYSIETLPVTLEKPKVTTKLYKFNEWTYDGKTIKEITDTSHTDIILKAKMTIQWQYVLIYISPCISFIILILTIWNIIKKRRQKHAIMDNNGENSI